MTFGPNHYVPVLKVKQGEKAALAAIAPGLRSRFTPLMEIVEIGEKKGQKKTLQEHLDTSFKGLATSVQPYRRCFLDAMELAPLGAQAAEAVFRRATAEGITFSPVTGISRANDVQAALAHRTYGLAIRLTRAEFDNGRLRPRLERFMKQHGLVAPDVDLILDLGELDNMVMEGVCALTEGFLGEVPEPTHWRTMTLSGCAFPKSMGEVPRLGAMHSGRLEWTAWRDSLHSNRRHLLRLPTFSDCAIQHSSGVEGFDPRTMRPSAAVRYALGDHWLLIKGVSTKTRPAKDQFPELADRLVYGDLNAYFAGEQHCHGCAQIKRAADGGPSLGSAGKWRFLGTVHHLTRAVEALAALPWP